MEEIDRPDLEQLRRQSMKNAPIINKAIINNAIAANDNDNDNDEEEVTLPYPLPPTDDGFLMSFTVDGVDFVTVKDTHGHHDDDDADDDDADDDALTIEKLEDANFDKYYTAIASTPTAAGGGGGCPWVSVVGASNIHDAVKDRYVINDKWIHDRQQEATRHYCSLRSPNPCYCCPNDIIIPLAKNIVVLARDGVCQRKWPYPYHDYIHCRGDTTVDDKLTSSSGNGAGNATATATAAAAAGATAVISKKDKEKEKDKEKGQSKKKKDDDYQYKPQEISVAVASDDGRLLLLGSTVYGISVDPNPSPDVDVDADASGLNAMVGCCSIHDSVDGRLVVMLSPDVRGGVVAGAFNRTSNKAAVLGGGLLRSLLVFAW